MSTPALAEALPRPGRVPLVEVVITEAIDARVVPHLLALLNNVLDLRPEQLVVDLAGCPTIDAVGVSALLDAHRHALRDGGRLSLRAPSTGVHHNLRLARVANVLHIILPEVTLPAADWSAAASTGAFVNPRPAR